MKKMQSIMTGVAVLAALALPMTAMAANKLVVQDGSSVDKFVVTDTGWIGSGLGTGVSPAGPLQIKANGTTTQSGGMIVNFTANGANPSVYIAPNFTFTRNNDPTVNGGLPRIGDSIGTYTFGTLINGLNAGKASIMATAETNWTATDTPSVMNIFTNPGGLNPATSTPNVNRLAAKFSSNGLMTVNGGLRLYPYTGTNNNAAIVPTKPTCDAATQGTLWFTKVSGADTLQICADGTGGIAWRNITIP